MSINKEVLLLVKTIFLGESDIEASAIAIGCMRLTDLDLVETSDYIEKVVDLGINFFDHADIYGRGACESQFGEALKKTSVRREDIYVQSKCGICEGYFDFSKKHIIDSVEKSLARLQTDYLDVLALHRPDTLVEPEEVAEAFFQLEKAGKVRQFGVSNQKPMQIELLQQSISQKLIVNQLQFGVKHTGMIDQGIHVNMTDEASVDHDGSVLDYSRLKKMTIQAWSPFQYGFFEGVFLDNPKFPELNETINLLALEYGVSNTAIATSWILRHPAKMQVLVGSMSIERIEGIVRACEVELTRPQWYEIYRAAGNVLP